MSHLFLSPHFDDVVLSCGGTVHRLVAAGESVNVRTVMAGKPTRLPDTPFVKALHARWQVDSNPVQIRMQEDTAAIQRLGASTSRMMNWYDCIYRMTRGGVALYPSSASIFGEIHPDDVIARIVPTIVLAAPEIPRTIMAPLGVGHHIDHQIVREWAVTLKQYYPWVALKFYEEYPYTKDSQAVENALAILQQAYPALRLTQETVPLEEADVQAKIEAIACYKSQISSFWNDLQDMESATRQSLIAAGGGTPAERYWVVS